jgi:hypothetical protein
MLLAEVELGEATGEELDVEGLLAFAESVLTDAARLWEQASLDHKQRLQGVLFPKGLSFDGSGFGTSVTYLAFSELASLHDAQDGLASPSIANSNRLAGWLRRMNALRQAIGTAARAQAKVPRRTESSCRPPVAGGC